MTRLPKNDSFIGFYLISQLSDEYGMVVRKEEKEREEKTQRRTNRKY